MALTDNIVAYWKLDESSGDATDSVGGFTAINNGTTGYVAALINNGVDYGTANSTKYMRAASDVGITGGAITISTWIKMRTEIASATQCIALQGDAGVDVNYIITYEYNAGTRRLGFNRQKQALSNNWTYGSATLGTASWHHVVLTYDGTNLAGWLDGTQVASNLATSGNGGSAAVDQVFLGHDDGQFAATYLSAYQDETGIWSRALTSGEISSLYNSGAGLTYPFGGGSPTFAPRMSLLGVGR